MIVGQAVLPVESLTEFVAPAELAVKGHSDENRHFQPRAGFEGRLCYDIDADEHCRRDLGSEPRRGCPSPQFLIDGHHWLDPVLEPRNGCLSP